ncbi:hypothetical protein MKW92_025616, partial [Papaver armeniacum]
TSVMVNVLLSFKSSCLEVHTLVGDFSYSVLLTKRILGIQPKVTTTEIPVGLVVIHHIP